MPGAAVKNNRGIALLITLTVIALLIPLALELNKRVRASIVSTARTRDRITLSHMVSSGVNMAIAMLVRDKIDSETDSFQEDWANAEKIDQLLQDIPFEDGSLTVKISDELSRIQVNALVEYPGGHNFNESQKILWDRFIRFIVSQNESLNDSDATSIINAIKDWIDSRDDDAITGLNGAESDYYMALSSPYPCRNGPLPHSSELLLVKGITPEIYNGLPGTTGISNFITIYGMTGENRSNFTYEGKININTAELPVILSLLPSEDENLARAICEFRQETSGAHYINDLTNPMWYKKVPGCSDIEINPKLITTSSNIFRIESAATLNETKAAVTAVIRRQRDKKTGKWECRVLKWHPE